MLDIRLSENVQECTVMKFITKAMKNGKVKLTAGGKMFAEVKIAAGVF